MYVTGGGRDWGNSGIYAFDAETGRRLWRTSGSSGSYPYAASSSAVYGFTVTANDTTEVVANDAATGRMLWAHDAGQILDSAKVGWLSYADGRVYIAGGTTVDNAAGQPTVRALDARTGRRVWRAYGGSLQQTPAIAGGLIYIADATSAAATSGHLIALDTATGTRQWRSANLGGATFFQPVVGSGIVCCAAGNSAQAGAFGLDSRTGRERWHARMPGLPLAATRGIVIFLEISISLGETSRFTIWARNISTGASAWTRKFPGSPALAAADNVLYLGSGTRTLQAFTATTGQLRRTQRLAAPADITTGNGAVYALDQNGTVSAYQA